MFFAVISWALIQQIPFAHDIIQRYLSCHSYEWKQEQFR